MLQVAICQRGLLRTMMIRSADYDGFADVGLMGASVDLPKRMSAISMKSI